MNIGQNAGVGCHALLQGIFLTQGSNLGLLHCKQILYQLSYQGSPLVLPYLLVIQFVQLLPPQYIFLTFTITYIKFI